MGELMEERPAEGTARATAPSSVAQVGGRTTYWCPVHQH